MRHGKVALAAIAGACLLSASAQAGPTFILTDTGGVGAGTQARAGFEAAAALWGNVLATDVTIRLDLGFKTLASSVLGSTSSSKSVLSYGAVRSALIANASSAADQSAIASLGPNLSFLSNEAGNCSTGAGCTASAVSSRTLDDDNTYDNNNLVVSNSLKKVLGLATDNGARDGSIAFNSSFVWDFDRSGGITTGSYDFVGIAAHEIGHALGFVSGVDTADSGIGTTGWDNRAWGTVLDLFRYSGTQRDWTVGGTPCLSADAGTSCIGLMATGAKYGDKRQASHWKDGKGLGILDPTAAKGELLKLTANDKTALDIIGWTLADPSVPTSYSVQWADNPTLGGFGPTQAEQTPSAPALTLFGGALALLGAVRRRQRSVRV